jgi:hypothetical protein
MLRYLDNLSRRIAMGHVGGRHNALEHRAASARAAQPTAGLLAVPVLDRASRGSVHHPRGADHYRRRLLRLCRASVVAGQGRAGLFRVERLVSGRVALQSSESRVSRPLGDGSRRADRRQRPADSGRRHVVLVANCRRHVGPAQRLAHQSGQTGARLLQSDHLRRVGEECGDVSRSHVGQQLLHRVVLRHARIRGGARLRRDHRRRHARLWQAARLCQDAAIDVLTHENRRKY